MLRRFVLPVAGATARTAQTSALHLTVVRALSTNRKGTVGFIGLGNMGMHMAKNLLKAGHPLVVYDVNTPAVTDAINSGAKAAASPKELAAQCGTIITMLPSSPHVREVYNGPHGIVHGVSGHPTLLIDSSTIDPTTARQVATMFQEKGSIMVDAPVSGGVQGAQNATLTFMVGGSEAAFAAAKPFLTKMGRNVVHCGDVGTGQVAKICNNLVLAVSMVAVSEGMNLGVKLGMDPKKLAGIFNTSSARCWSSDTYNPCPGVMDGVPAARGYTGGFGVDLMKKDLGLAMQAAQDARANVPTAALVHELYKLLAAQGYGKKDFSAIFEFLNRQT